ncbi:MAG TPA: hypothetical protein VGM67_05650 [Gemmatimonadaceae bacterium]|jgi:hypothetical protein
MMRCWFAGIIPAIGFASLLGAQSVHAADSLLQAGELQRAEGIYYAAVRARPHDPIARWALGRYLVSRGAPRVGATLFEESLKFGGEPSIVGPDLVAADLTIGNYTALSTLPSATAAERARAKWIAARSPRTIAPESLIVAQFQRSNESSVIGHIPIRVNGRTIDAVVSAEVHGIVIADTVTVARTLHTFGVPRGKASRDPELAAADSVAIARLTMIAVPVLIDHIDRRQAATIGLDVLAQFAPTFDPVAGRLVLRPGGVVTNVGGERFATLTTPTDIKIARAGGWASLTQSSIARMLHERRWTFDARRGELVVTP